jgi:hypothetical protein
MYTGATARLEYNDNYFFLPVDTQAAFTASVTPFFTATRRTETSEVTALVAVGANDVWGVSPSVDPYLSGRLELTGSLRDARSTWSGNASFVRSANLQNEPGQTGGAPLVLAFSNALLATGAYSYALTERWSVGPTLGAYSNRYEAIENGVQLSNNHGYFVVANGGYAYSDRTQINLTAGYMNDVSDLSSSNSLTATVSIAHQYSERLTVSASLGAFWSDTEIKSLAEDNHRRDSGGLYGGSISYAISDRMQLGVSLTEGLTPSASGTLTQTDVASASLTHRFSDRLTGRLGASYTRTVIPVTLSSSVTNDEYVAEIGLSYLLAERWKLDAGYRYTSANYEQTAGVPRSNLIFVSIAFNWPGASFTDWVRPRSDTQAFPGAGATSLPVQSPQSRPTPSVPSEPSLPESSPFDQLSIP